MVALSESQSNVASLEMGVCGLGPCMGQPLGLRHCVTNGPVTYSSSVSAQLSAGQLGSSGLARALGSRTCSRPGGRGAGGLLAPAAITGAYTALAKAGLVAKAGSQWEGSAELFGTGDRC